MTNEEITMYRDALTAQLEGKPWQWQRRKSQQWYDSGDEYDVLHHIKAGNFVRPEPVQTYRTWTMDDVPPVCWLRYSASHFNCVSVDALGLSIFCNEGITHCSWEDLAEGYEWSADRKTWQPCRIEVQS